LSAVSEHTVESWAGRDLVFLVGHPRSGTTFLGRLLGSHPDIGYWEEADLLRFAIWYATELTRLHHHLRVDATMDPLALSHQSTRDQLELAQDEQHQANLAAMDDMRFALRRLQLAFNEQSGKRLLLEKTPTAVVEIQHLDVLLPDARVIHIMRDPRDIAASTVAWMQRTGWPDWLGELDEDPVRATALQWKEMVGQGLSGAARIGAERVITVRHEDVIADARREVERLLGFLGLSWSPRLDDFLRTGHGAGLDKETVGRWRERLTPEQVDTVVQEVGPMMDELGYGEGDGKGATRRGWRPRRRARRRSTG
jgi:hypothetical protein